MRKRNATPSPSPVPSDRASDIREGRIAAVDEAGRVWVKLGEGRPVRARVARSLQQHCPDHTTWPGKAVLVLPAERPIVVDFIDQQVDLAPPPDRKEVVVEGQRLVFEGKEQIELRCGKATITLTRAGKILIRGAYLSNRSSGVNRVMGGSVQIN
jgi:hypothetical protein